MAKHLFCLLASGALVTSQVSIFAATPSGTASPTQDNVRYIGAVTCQSSMCHGGAGPARGQYMTWVQDDFHSRSYATLITARSVQIGLGVKPEAITSPQTNPSCTSCHAPMADCTRASTATVEEGVSCESCHGAAAGWLRGHTRADWTYADRVHAGMTDMRDAYDRANTCVKCHQVIAPNLIAAGHPALIFEMDGQAASEPRHWTEKSDWFGPKAWAVGQAVALSKIATQIDELNKTDDKAGPDLIAQQQALVWLMSEVRPVHVDTPAGTPTAQISSSASAEAIAAWSNELAHSFSSRDWSHDLSGENLMSLAGTSASFTDGGVPLPERKLRAERLVLGLDRLFKAEHAEKDAPGATELSALFGTLQDPSPTVFDAPDFSTKLQKFAEAIGKK